MPGETIADMKVLDFFAKDGPVAKYWNSPFCGVPLWLIASYKTLKWLQHPPAPGYAIGTLAVVAGIMSVRDIKVLGKMLWVVLLICMVNTEFRAIDDDRAESAEKQKAFFESQKSGFQSVTDQAKNNFDVTARSLQQAINGLNTSLDVATRTYRQTEAHVHSTHYFRSCESSSTTCHV